MAEGDILQFELNDLFDSLTSIRDYFTSVTTKSSSALIEAKILRFNELKTQFNDLRKQVFLFNADIKDKNLCLKDNKSSFNDLFDSIQELYIKVTRKNAPPTIAGQLQSKPSSSLNMPQIDIPKFNGDIENWQNFKALYDSLVHVNNAIPTIQKLHILRSKLEGPAAILVANIQLDEANYDHTYKILEERYASKRRLIHYYLAQILNFKTTNSEFKSYSQFLTAHFNSIEAIKSLQLNDGLDTILFYLAYQNLNNKDKQQFDNTLDSSTLPTCKDLMDFIRKRAQSVDLQVDSKSNDKQIRKKPLQDKFKSNLSLVAKAGVTSHHVGENYDKQVSQKCPVCISTEHKIYNCPVFTELSVNEKYDKLKQLNRCFKCLGFHNKTDCKSNSSCRICQLNSHHTLLHLDKVKPTCNIANHDKNVMVLLSTIELEIQDSNGSFHKVKAVLDNGSQVNAISSSLCKRLGLQCFDSHSTVTGFASSHVLSRKETKCSIRSPYQWRTKVEFHALVINEICSDLPHISLPSEVVQRFQSLNLADKTFFKPSKIDILLGAEIYAQILTSDKPVIIPGEPTAISSSFGYFLTGKVKTTSPCQLSLLVNNQSLDQTIRQFWEVENVEVCIPQNKEDILMEKHFVNTVSRTTQGRFQVQFYFKPHTPPLGSNRDDAMRRFINLEKRLLKDPPLKKIYDDFFHEYYALNHMRPALSKSSYILPHFAIYKPMSSSQVVRAVFDASALDEFNCSLNSKLCVGPKLQKDLPQIIDSFRQHNVTVCCDIQKLFRNILVAESDRKYQHIFWRANTNEPVQEWELNTVCYGISNSPFLAQRCLIELVNQEAVNGKFSLASYALQNHCYIDDIITGQPDIVLAKQLQQELMDILNLACFTVKKWSSNNLELLSPIVEQDKEKIIVFSDDTKGIKILGLLWNPQEDIFSYHVAPFTNKITKRNMLSYIAKIFDCNGYIGPVILKSKKFIQDLWLQGVSWDEEIQDPLRSNFKEFVDEFPLLSKLKIPRKIFYPNATFRILGFCDACEYGLGAAVYLHVSDENYFKCHLLRTKTKVAPLKSLTIPKLELSAALLLVKLIKTMMGNIFTFNIHETLYFTDSKIVLSWLSTAPHLLQTFVSNRVVQILEYSNPQQWFHISSNENCSDICSRGATPSQLINCSLYWNGPTFASQSYDQWPLKTFIKIDSIPELKKTKTVLTATHDNSLIKVIERYSSLLKLQRVFAYCLRFINNIKSPTVKRYGCLSTEELQLGLMACVKITQISSFFNEIKSIEKGTTLPNNLKRLSPFIDKNGIVLVGGRLGNSSLPFSSRHPILLNSKSHLATLICDYYHIYTCHSGVATVQALIQQKWWILSLRSLLKRQIFNCLRCYRLKAKPVAPFMSPLPAPRVQVSSCFQVTGMDYFGFLEVKESLRRNARCYKSYGLILVCFATKAIHIEMVTSLSTEAFLAAFDRFTSRRGLPLQLHCDRGTSFIGASREIKEIQKWLSDNSEIIFSSLAARQVQFKFNCPTAASMGGLWESGVKSAKTLMYRMVGASKFTLDEYITIFTRIEAVLNSRPLCYLIASPDEGTDYLSPGHFLIGKPILNFPEQLIPDDINLKTRWLRVREIVQSFWKRWSKEYLHTQIQRSKWADTHPNLEIGQVVLLSDLRTSPLSWPLGRVVEIFPGKDQVIRVCKIKTLNGTYMRPANKLIALHMI